MPMEINERRALICLCRAMRRISDSGPEIFKNAAIDQPRLWSNRDRVRPSYRKRSVVVFVFCSYSIASSVREPVA